MFFKNSIASKILVSSKSIPTLFSNSKSSISGTPIIRSVSESGPTYVKIKLSSDNSDFKQS